MPEPIHNALINSKMTSVPEHAHSAKHSSVYSVRRVSSHHAVHSVPRDYDAVAKVSDGPNYCCCVSMVSEEWRDRNNYQRLLAFLCKIQNSVAQILALTQ